VVGQQGNGMGVSGIFEVAQMHELETTERSRF
jgi:hypothetical protein